MIDRSWADRDPFGDASDGEDGSYRAWRSNGKGGVRDLCFIPAPGSDQPKRFESYMQVISMELKADGSELCLACHTSGQMVFITGQNLADMAEQISLKRVASVHVWDESQGPQPDTVVTAIRFDKTFSAAFSE